MEASITSATSNIAKTTTPASNRTASTTNTSSNINTVPTSNTSIVTPGPHDIVCGRGKSISAHPGNQRFRQLILTRRDEYQQAEKRDDKSRITAEVVDALRSMSSRFLLKDATTNLYYEVGMEYIKEKVSHALRSRGKPPGAAAGNRSSYPQRRQSNRASPSSHPQTTPCFSKHQEEQVQSLIEEQQQLLKNLIKDAQQASSSFLPG